MSQPGEQFLKAFQETAPWIHVGGGRFMQLMTALPERVPMTERMKPTEITELLDTLVDSWQRAESIEALADYDDSWAE